MDLNISIVECEIKISFDKYSETTRVYPYAVVAVKQHEFVYRPATEHECETCVVDKGFMKLVDLSTIKAVSKLGYSHDLVCVKYPGYRIASNALLLFNGTKKLDCSWSLEIKRITTIQAAINEVW